MVAKKRAILPLTALIAILCMSFSIAFSLSAGEDITICAGTTSTIVDNILDSGSYTITSSGTASSFSTIVPSGIAVSSQGAVYAYVSPPSYALPGAYDLVIKFENQDKEVKEITHNIKINDCHASALTVDADKVSCTCEEATYLIKLKNYGDYLESYDIFVEGNAKEWVTLSDSIIILGAGEEKLIKAYAKSPCNTYGKYDLTFKSKASTSLSVAEAKAAWDIKPCYEYSISAPLDYYSLCENSELTLPLTLKNTGTIDNSYNIKISAPNWVILEKNKLDVKSQESINSNILINPPYQTKGNFSILTEATSVTGDVKKSITTAINVRTCYNALIDIDKEEDRLCNAVSNKYEVRVKNTGDFSNTYDLSVEGAEWAELNEQRITLAKDEEKILILDVHPAYDTEAKTYEITINALDELSKASSSDSINVIVATNEQCYQPSINAKQESIELMKDSTATDLIIIENKGTNNATYIIDLSGTASKFAEINPGLVNIEPGKAEVIYLYIAPTLLTTAGDYDAIVTARLKDSTVLSSKTIKIKLNEFSEEKKDEIIVTGDIEEIKEEQPKSNIFSGIGKWFSTAFSNTRLFFSNLIESFKIKPKESSLQGELTIGELKTEFQNNEMSEDQIRDYFKSLNVSDDSTSLFIEKWKSEIEEEKAVEEVPAEEIVENLTENITEDAIVEPAENVTIEEIVEENITIEQPAAENVTIELNETTVEGVSNESLVNITVEEQPSLEEEQPPAEEVKAPQLDLTKYKKYIIGAVIIVLIMLLFITGFWKKIIEFFEEEVDDKKNGKK